MEFDPFPALWTRFFENHLWVSPAQAGMNRLHALQAQICLAPLRARGATGVRKRDLLKAPCDDLATQGGAPVADEKRRCGRALSRTAAVV